jgi:transposase
VIIPAPCACSVCGGRLAKVGEDITETLEIVQIVPRQWKVIQTVREKFSCRFLREDHPAAGSVSSHCPRPCWS